MNWGHPSNTIGFASLKNRRYALLGLSVTLAVVYTTLLWRSGDEAHLGMSLLFGVAVVNLLGEKLGEKQTQLRLKSEVTATIAGILLIALTLWQSTPVPSDPALINPVLRLMPFLSALGVGLIASGWQQLKQYWQELTLLFFLGGPSVLATFLPDISPLTAQVSGFLLHYVGFDVSVDGVFVHLPTGAVEVYSGCSGLESMTYLLGVSVLCLLLFPLQGIKRFLIPFLAVGIGYFINACRVAAMALLAASKNESAFKYWHEGNGSLLVGAIAILVFGLLYLLLLRLESSAALPPSSTP